MSAGFGIGLTRQFCPVDTLEQRLTLLTRVAEQLQIARLVDFVHPDDPPEWSTIHQRESYRAVRVTQGSSQWLGPEETDELQQAIGPHWSDGGSYEDCFLLGDEETSLLLPGINPELLNRNGKTLIQVEPEGDSLVVMETGLALENLKQRLDDAEFEFSDTTLSVLERGKQLMQAALEAHLPFYFAWD